MTIEDRAKELGRLIGQTTEYQAFRRANEALAADKDALAVLQRMEQLRSDAQAMMDKGTQPTKEMEDELDGLLQQMQVTMSYQRLMVAQANFDKTMGHVNEWILDGIERGATSSIITLS